MSNARRSKQGMKQLPLDLDYDEVEVAGTKNKSTAYIGVESKETEIEDVLVYDEPHIEVVSVVLCRHKIVNVTGKVTGRTYTFRGAGSIRDDVDIRDAEIMVNQNPIQSCCGSFSTAQFQILGR